MKRLFLTLPALLVATAIGAHAETSNRADPSDPSQAGIKPTYRSAFDGYLPHQNGIAPSLENWRAANELVGSLGGHGGHLDAESPSLDHSAHQQPKTPEARPAPEHGEHHHAH